jgi:hypothetical protein
VTATEVSLSGFSRSAFSRRNPGASSRWPNGRFLNSRCPCLSPVTMDYCGYFCTFARGTAAFAPLHCLLSSGPPALVSSSYAPSQSSGFPMLPPLEPCLSLYSILYIQHSRFLPTGQLINRSTRLPRSGQPSLRAFRVFPLSTCQLAHVPPRESACPRVTVPAYPLEITLRVISRTPHSPLSETPDEYHSGRNSSDRCAG